MNWKIWKNFYEGGTETYAALFVVVALLGVVLVFLLHKKKVFIAGGESIGKILLLSFQDDEDEMINSVLSALDTGRKGYCIQEVSRSSKIQYGDISIRLDKRVVFKRQQKIELTFTEFEILQLLAQNPGRVFSKEQIYDIVWNEPYSGDYNIIMSHISHIREKIEDDSGNPVYIQTVWGVGYRFNANLGSDS